MSVAGGDDTVSVNLMDGHRGDWQVQLRNLTRRGEFNIRLRSSIVYRPTCNLGRGGVDEPLRRLKPTINRSRKCSTTVS
jgi:hypothetical protein